MFYENSNWENQEQLIKNNTKMQPVKESKLYCKYLKSHLRF